MKKTILALLVLLAGIPLCGFFGPGLMMSGGAGGGPPVLDNTPGVTFAYGLRRLLTSYVANRAINVARAAGSPPTQDIGFTNNGDFNASAFNTFCSGTTCSVAVIYDQSGNGLDCTFPSGHRPPVALASIGGRASLQTTGNTGQFYCQTITSALLDFTGTAHSVFSEVQYTATADGGGTGGGRGENLGTFTHYNSGSFIGWSGDVGNTSRPGETFVFTLSSGSGTKDGAATHLTAINDGNPHFAGWTFSSGTVKITQDANTFTSAVSFQTPGSSGQPMTMLAFGDVTIDGFFSGNFAEGYGWGRALTTVEVAALNTSLIGYFPTGGTPQSIASVSLSNTTFPNSTANAAVGTVAVTMSPTTPAFSGSLSLTGANSGGFHLVGNNLQTNSAGTTSGTFSDVTIVATQAGVGGSPSSITPTLVGSSGIACDIGPPYVGSIPAGATASGYTHCAMNIDFTNASNFTYNGHTYNWQNLSTWLDCAGAANPLFYSVDFNSTGHNPPCSRTSIVTDGGVQVLDQQFQIADGSAGAQATWMQSAPVSSGAGIHFPNGIYIDATMRLSAASYFPNTPTNQTGNPIFDIFGSNCCPIPSVVENDLNEIYQAGGSGTTLHDWGVGGGVPYSFTTFPNFVDAGYSSGYITVGDRFTTNGTNYALCVYVADVQKNCSSSLAYTSTDNTARPIWGWGVGHLNTAGAITANMDDYMKSVVFWSCATWATTQCNTGVNTGSP